MHLLMFQHLLTSGSFCFNILTTRVTSLEGACGTFAVCWLPRRESRSYEFITLVVAVSVVVFETMVGCGVLPFEWLLETRSKVLWDDCGC